MIVLEPAARRALRAHAATAWPEECCGFLLGRGDRVQETVPASNRAADPRRAAVPGGRARPACPGR